MNPTRTALVFGMLLATIAKANPDQMKPLEVKGYALVDAEYLPFIGTATVRYPEDVLWGFYPDGATASAERCAEHSYKRLVEFFQADWSLMHQVVELGGTPRFTLWINDYSESGYRQQIRPGRLWHANDGARDYTQGSWKWESTLTQDGVCQVPCDEQIEAALKEAVETLSAPHSRSIGR